MEYLDKEEEGSMTGRESLELITRVINEARDDYRSTGISILYWGAIVTFCSLVTFANYYLHWDWLGYVWFLLIGAIIPQIMISKREKEARKFKTRQDDLIGGIWLSFAIAISLASIFGMIRNIPYLESLTLLLYGVPTFATGYGKACKPMIVGGIACWVFAVLALYTPWPYLMLLNAGAAQLAWFVPGIIMRRDYLKAKAQHV